MKRHARPRVLLLKLAFNVSNSFHQHHGSGLGLDNRRFSSLVLTQRHLPARPQGKGCKTRILQLATAHYSLKQVQTESDLTTETCSAACGVHVQSSQRHKSEPKLKCYLVCKHAGNHSISLLKRGQYWQTLHRTVKMTGTRPGLYCLF